VDSDIEGSAIAESLLIAAPQWCCFKLETDDFACKAGEKPLEHGARQVQIEERTEEVEDQRHGGEGVAEQPLFVNASAVLAHEPFSESEAMNGRTEKGASGIRSLWRKDGAKGSARIVIDRADSASVRASGFVDRRCGRNVVITKPQTLQQTSRCTKPRVDGAIGAVAPEDALGDERRPGKLLEGRGR
jgi:hypothetical protein